MDTWLKIFALAIISASFVGLGDSNHIPGSCGHYSLQPQYDWSVLKFDTPPSFTPHTTYQPNCTYITSIDEAGGLLYLSTPRDFDILPASLSTIPASVSVAKTSSPNLKPYPDLHWHRLPVSPSDCNSTLISVRATDKDGCNRLWVLDSGVIFDQNNTYQKICQPKLVVFNLATNKADKVIVLPDNVLKPLSVLCNIVLDSVLTSAASLIPSNSSCDNTFAYIADSDMGGLVVYSPSDQFYRISSPCMRPDPLYASVEMNGEIFDCYFGIYGMDVSGTGSSRTLYFQPVSSTSVFSIPTSFLQGGPFQGDPCDVPVATKFTKKSGGFALRADPSNACLLFNTISENSINTWNPTQEIQRTVVNNSSYLAAVYDIARDSLNKRQNYVLSVNLPRYIKGNVDSSATNMRILRLKNTH